MTLNQAEQEAYALTQKEISNFYKIIADEYRAAEKAMKKELEKLYLDIISGVAPKDYYNVVLKTRRLEKLILKVQDEYIKAANKAGILTASASRTAFSNNFYRQRFALAFASNSVNSFDLSFVLLPTQAIEISVIGTGKVWSEIIKRKFGVEKAYKPKHGTLLETLVKNRKEDLLKIRQAITQGLIQGKSYAQTTRVIQELMNNVRYKAARIVRTEGHRNMLAGQYANVVNARQEFGVNVRRQILSTLDDITRQQSVQVDTLLENDNGVFIYPGGVEVYFPGDSGVAAWDIHDREIVISILKDYPPNKRIGRNPLTGKNEEISFKSFSLWAKENGLTKNRYGQYVG